MVTLPWPEQALPVIAVAGRFPHFDRQHEQSYCCSTHALHLYEYAAELCTESGSFELAAGDLTLSPARRITSYAMLRAGQHLCVHFWPARSPQRGPLAKLPLVVRLGRQREATRLRLAEIIRLHARASAGSAAAARPRALLLELLLSLGDADAEPPLGTAQARAAVEAAATFLDAHPSEPLSVPALARRVGLSQNYLARLFRERFGRTLSRYSLERRIELSRQLLRATELGIKEVAARVGLCDAQHLNKQFRRFTGLSPSAFRASVRAERAG